MATIARATASGGRIPWPSAVLKYFDEFYLYDGVYRLTSLARGLLTGGPPPTGVTGHTFGESWSLDTTGNWGGYTQESTAGTDTLAQTRSQRGQRDHRHHEHRRQRMVAARLRRGGQHHHDAAAELSRQPLLGHF